jgi:hypothetical protein
LKNAFANFVDPITPDELAGLAMEVEVDSRLVSHFNGEWQAAAARSGISMVWGNQLVAAGASGQRHWRAVCRAG